MKRLTIIFTLLLAVLLPSCTQNNGHIGHWFGQWKVERVTIDGVDDPDYKGNVFFCFQGAVFGVRASNGAMFYGRWEETEENSGVVNVTFNTDESSVPSSTYYHVYLEAQTTLRLLSKDGNTKQLEQVASDGKTYVYYLKKW